MKRCCSSCNREYDEEDLIDLFADSRDPEEFPAVKLLLCYSCSLRR